MKWWKKSYDSLTLVEWHELKSSLDISKDILVREYYSLREGFTSGGEEHDCFFSKFWKEKKSLSNHCSELRGERYIAYNIFYKYHLRLKYRKPWGLYLLIELPTREDSVESCEVHTVSK